MESHENQRHTRYIDPDTLLKYIPLDNGKFLTFKHPAFSSSHPNWPSSNNTLQTIPVEIYQTIITHASIQDLTTLRRTSQYSRSVIDGMPTYQDLLNFAPSAIRAVLATSRGINVSLKKLHYTLTHPSCFLCSASFANLLFLFTGDRVCNFCLYNHHSLQTFEIIFSMQDSTLEDFRDHTMTSGPTEHKLITVEGNYTNQERTFEKVGRKLLVFHSWAMEEHLRQVREDTPDELIGSTSPQKDFSGVGVEYHNPFVIPKVESDIRVSKYTILARQFFTVIDEAESDKYELTQLRRLTAIEMPFMNPKTKEEERGSRCRECRLNMRFREFNWKTRQEIVRVRTVIEILIANNSTRDSINEVRKRSCDFFLGDDLKVHMVVMHEGELKADEKIFRERLERSLVDALRAGKDVDIESVELLRS